MNLVLFEPDEVSPGGRVLLGDDPRSRHLRNVLNAEAGSRIRVGLVDGQVGVGTVVQVTGTAIELNCRFDGAVPARPRVSLLLAMPRPKVLKRLWAQLAALGVDRVLITNASRVERVYFDTHVLEDTFIRKHCLEGLQQAVDTRLPRVSIHRRLKVLVEDELDTGFPGALRLAAHPGAAMSLPAACSNAGDKPVLLAVGPEGGWVPYELEMLMERGFQTVSMGPRVLRSDTACIALLAQVYASLG